MKMCMWCFGGDKINFDRITAFKLTNFLAAFTLMGRHFVKSTSSTVYNHWLGAYRTNALYSGRIFVRFNDLEDVFT